MLFVAAANLRPWLRAGPGFSDSVARTRGRRREQQRVCAGRQALAPMCDGTHVSRYLAVVETVVTVWIGVKVYY